MQRQCAAATRGAPANHDERAALNTDRKPSPLGPLAAAGFLSLLSTRLCDAMLPALTQAFSVTTSEASAVISAYAVAYGLMQLVYGPLGDRYGKVFVILLATAFCALGTALAAAAPTLAMLVLARAAMGAGTAAIVPLSIAWIGDTVALEQRQQTLARYAGVTVLGLTSGPLLGGYLSEALSWRAAFVLLALAFAAMSLALLPRARRPDHVAGDAPSMAAPTYWQKVRRLLGDRWARRVLAAGCIENALAVGSLAFVPTVLHERFGLSLLQGGAVTALYGLGGFVFSRSAARLLGRVRRAAMPALAGVTLAAAFTLLALMPSWHWAALGCAVGGFGYYMLHNTLQMQATQLASGASGLAVSLFASNVFIGQSIGVAAGAFAIAHVAAAWIFAATAAGLLLLGLALARALAARERG